jgi:ribonuclease P protein component
MLAKNQRITKQKEFDRFFGLNFKKRSGRSAAGVFLIVKILKTDVSGCRFGFIVPNTVDKRSTVRNRIKRQMREIVRLKMNELRPGNDVLIIAKPGVKNKSYQEIKLEMLKLFKLVQLNNLPLIPSLPRRGK